MKAFIDTNGCTLGQLESKRVQEFFERNDETIVVTPNPQEADVIIFFACGLTDVSEKASLQLIAQLQPQRKPLSRIIVWGCLAKMNPESLSQVYDGPLIGPRDIDFFNELVEARHCDCHEVWSNTLARSFADDRSCGLKPHSFVNDTILSTMQRLLGAAEANHHKHDEIFYLRVASGCTGHCTYCSEKLAWGRIKSRPINEVTAEFKAGIEKGYKRFFLCAEDLGPYGQDLGYTIIDLLSELISADKNGNCRLIVDQFNAEFLEPNLHQLFDVFASGRIELFNCQVQSGSNRILKMMGREPLSREWREAMLSIDRKFPEVRLGTHFIVGFPSETEEEFEDTLKLLDYPLFMRALSVYMFSGKSRAVASRMKEQVPESVKRSRYKRLMRKYLYMYSFHSTIGRLMK